MDRPNKVRIKPAMPLLLIAVVAAIAYANSVKGRFIWDDDFLVKNNVYIRSWSNIPGIFLENMGSGAKEKTGFYRPLQDTSYAIDYSLYGMNPAGFHVTNILLHILTGMVLYWLIKILSSSQPLSLLAALLFVAHPINTETVAYISDRAECLVALFMLLGTVSYLRHLRSKNLRLYVLTIAAFILALFSKENGLIFPFLLLSYHFVFRIRPRIKDLAPLFVIAAGYLACRMTFLHSVSFYNYPADILFQRVPGFFVAIADYLSLLVFPFNLHMEYSYRIFAFTEPKAIMGMIIASLMMIYAFVKKDKNPLISFSIFWFFLALLPVSNIYPINASYMKEHWLYFPAAGLLVIPAYCLSLLYRKSRWVALPFIVALLAIYCCLTIKQNDYWKEPITFYKKTAECNPRSWKAYNALGLEYMAIGDYAKALDAYQMAINSIPHAAKADTAEWIAYQASEDSARRLVAQNLTSAYRAMEEEMALAEKRGTKGVFLLANRYYEEGNECMVLGRVKEAVAYYNAALRLDPRNPLVSDALGRAYFVSARYKEAIAVFNKMLEIDPGLAAAHNNLAVAYYMEKDYDQAIKHCDEAVSMGYQVEDKLLGWLKPYRK